MSQEPLDHKLREDDPTELTESQMEDAAGASGHELFSSLDIVTVGGATATDDKSDLTEEPQRRDDGE